MKKSFKKYGLLRGKYRKPSPPPAVFFSHFKDFSWVLDPVLFKGFLQVRRLPDVQCTARTVTKTTWTRCTAINNNRDFTNRPKERKSYMKKKEGGGAE